MPAGRAGRGLWVCTARAASIASVWLAVTKVVDVLGAAVLLRLTTPILLLIAAVIRLRHPDVVGLIGRRAMGEGGRQFRMRQFSAPAPDSHLARSAGEE